MIFVDFVVLRENFWFLPPKIRSRRHVGAGWFLTTALVGMLLSQNITTADSVIKRIPSNLS